MSTTVVLMLVPIWVLSMAAIAGWVYAHDQRKYPTLAVSHRREDAGAAVLMAFTFGLLAGPLTAFIIFCITGFAEHGWLCPGRKP